MGRSILLEVLDRPAASVIIGICVAVWLRIHSAGLSYQDVGCSFEMVVQRRQVWRLLTAQLSHVSGLHLLFNASALWNLGAIEQHSSALSAGGSGTLFYISYTMLFFVASALGIMALYAVAIYGFRREQDASTMTLGYSCVVFAWLAYTAASAGALVTDCLCSIGCGATSTYTLLGVSVPANLMPFGALVLTSIIVPQASFLGHLAGIISGYLVAVLPHVPLLLNLGIFACFMGLVGWSYLQQFQLDGGGSLVSYFRLHSADSDVELG